MKKQTIYKSRAVCLFSVNSFFITQPPASTSVQMSKVSTSVTCVTCFYPVTPIAHMKHSTLYEGIEIG